MYSNHVPSLKQNAAPNGRNGNRVYAKSLICSKVLEPGRSWMHHLKPISWAPNGSFARREMRLVLLYATKHDWSRKVSLKSLESITSTLLPRLLSWQPSERFSPWPRESILSCTRSI